MSEIKPKLTAGELFAGYGGLALAVEQSLNARTEWVCEFEEAPSKILAKHFPDAPNFRDVTAIDWETIPHVDIISGGSPCQDVSLAGSRRGMTEGTRSNLWVSMREAIKTIRPRLVVWENVKGVRSAKASSDLEQCTGCMGEDGRKSNAEPALRALGRVLGDLASIGYSAQWCSIRASDIGGPHRRERVFILAWRNDLYTYKDKSQEKGLAGAHETWKENKSYLMPTPNTMDSLNWRDGEARIKALKRGREDRKPSKRTGNLREEVHFNFHEYRPAIEHWERVTGNKAPSPTKLSESGRPLLNPEFSEWMMGLPKGWITSPDLAFTRSQQFKAIGNGVVPQQAAAAIAEMVANLEEIKETRGNEHA